MATKYDSKGVKSWGVCSYYRLSCDIVIETSCHSGYYNTYLAPLNSEFGPDLMWESWWLLGIGRQFTVQNPDQLYMYWFPLPSQLTITI